MAPYATAALSAGRRSVVEDFDHLEATWKRDIGDDSIRREALRCVDFSAPAMRTPTVPGRPSVSTNSRQSSRQISRQRLTLLDLSRVPSKRPVSEARRVMEAASARHSL
jgi:hypothetical protein